MDFVTKEVEKRVTAGVMIPWTGAHRPRVVSVLLVVEEVNLRLCLNTMYASAHAECMSFKYERIADMADITRPGDFIYTTDDKSGYWQVSFRCSTPPWDWSGAAASGSGLTSPSVWHWCAGCTC